MGDVEKPLFSILHCTHIVLIYYLFIDWFYLIYLSICLSVCLSVCLFVCLSIYLYLSIYLIYLSIYLSMCVWFPHISPHKLVAIHLSKVHVTGELKVLSKRSKWNCDDLSLSADKKKTQNGKFVATWMLHVYPNCILMVYIYIYTFIYIIYIYIYTVIWKYISLVACKARLLQVAVIWSCLDLMTNQAFCFRNRWQKQSFMIEYDWTPPYKKKNKKWIDPMQILVHFTTRKNIAFH